MCGRFSLGTDPRQVAAAFGLAPELLPDQPRYNVAPTQSVLAVVRDADGLRAGPLRWGLVPAWAKDPAVGSRMINARSETVDSKPSFRSLFRGRRCWVLADGFYEWKKEPGKGPSQPYYFRMPDGRPFAFAGLWDRWARGDDELVTCTILTTAPNAVVAPVHDRMPVILPAEVRDRWLDPDTGAMELKALLRPYPGELEGFPVSRLVNAVANDTPEVRQAATPNGPA